jgi:hypothetical protein
METGDVTHIGAMTWALYIRDYGGEAWAPLILGESGTNILTIPAATYNHPNKNNTFCFPLNSSVSALQLRVELISGTQDTYASKLVADTMYVKIALIEDNNLAILSAMDCKQISGVSGSRGRPNSWSGDSAFNATRAQWSTFHVPLAWNYDWMFCGEWGNTQHITRLEIDTVPDEITKVYLFDNENFAAESNRWILPVQPQYESTVFTEQYIYSTARGRIAQAGVNGTGHPEVVVSLSADRADPPPGQDFNVYPLDPNTPFIDVLGFAQVLQGTGVVDPDHFTNSTIDLLDSVQDIIATITVAEVSKAFTNEEWETSQKLVANDALLFRFDITAYPTAAFFTNWAPNKALGTGYDSTTTTGYYETLPADYAAVEKYIQINRDPRRCDVTYRNLLRYVGGKKQYEATGKSVPVRNIRKRETWPNFFARMERLSKLMAENKAAAKLETIECSESMPLTREIPHNTTWVDITIESPTDNMHAAFKNPELRALRSPRHQGFGNHIKQNSEDLTGAQDLRGEITVARRPHIFKKLDKGEITFRFFLIANTHPRVNQYKTAHYIVWHTDLVSIKLPQNAIIKRVEFIKSNILTKTTTPDAIHAEVWHTDIKYTVPPRETRAKEGKTAEEYIKEGEANAI